MAQLGNTPNLYSQRARILCVDDSLDLLFIYRSFLESRGYEVVTANNGKAALQILKEHSVDAAITDNEMPGMNGVQLACEMKHVQTNLPILMFSAARPDALPSIDYFLDKGSGPLALIEALQSLLPSMGSFSEQQLPAILHS